MPRKRAPARLWFREDTGTWVIKDGTARISTGYTRSEIALAERELAAYHAKTYTVSGGSRADEVKVIDALVLYAEAKLPNAKRPQELSARIRFLGQFFSKMKIGDIRGQTCRDYAAQRSTEAAARRELEDLRSAINYYHSEYTLDRVPKITLPGKSHPRDVYLTRSDAAKLLKAARSSHHTKHLTKLILIGLYTGSRLEVISGLQWMPNTIGGHVDIEAGIIYRRAIGERVAHNKRKPPAKIPRRLMTFLRYWHRKDAGRGFVFHRYDHTGEMIKRPQKAFRNIRRMAGLDEKITPHVLRHTRATWLLQAGVDINVAADALGLTVQEMERTYGHVDPMFQDEAANAY